MLENRNGLLVQTFLTEANGRAERVDICGLESWRCRVWFSDPDAQIMKPTMVALC
jgi:hypothetical protein